MLSSDSALDLLTKAFSESQDHLLAISALGHARGHHFEFEQLLVFLSEQARGILGAKAVFLAILLNSQAPLLVSSPSNHFNIEKIIPLLNCKNNSLAAIQIIQLEEDSPVYVLDQKIKGKGRIKLGFQVDIPKSALTPTLSLAQTISEQARIQIENVLLHKELLAQAKFKTEMEAARQMQASLLPKNIPPSQETGLDIAVHFKPASLVGGDFYDLDTHINGVVAFAIGDISGKGLPASLLMAMTLNALRNAFRFISNPTPTKILAQVNQGMYDDFTQACAFATVFAGSYNMNKRQLSYGNAGHSPVIFCPSEGQASLLEADGTALGVLLENVCETHTLYLHPDDILLIGTDGFSEAENSSGEMFGYENLLRLIEKCRSQPSQGIINCFVDAINKFASGHIQSDDQTLMVIKAV